MTSLGEVSILFLEIPRERDFFMPNKEIQELPAVFLTEGTGSRPSTHKSSMASVALGLPVEPIKVRGPEPDHFSDPLELILSKWYLFHLNAAHDNVLHQNEVLELVADVTCGFRRQASTVLSDARKEKIVRGETLSERQKDVASRVASRFAKWGKQNVVAHMDAALVLAHAQYGDSGGVVVASGVSESRIMLPGNPLKDQGLFAEYLDWANLGEKHLSAVPWAVDMATAIGFLSYIKWWNKQGYVYGGTGDLIKLPTSYSVSHASDQRYLNERLEFFYAHGRLPEKILDSLDPASLVGLLSTAFNFPNPFVGAVLESAAETSIKKQQIIYQAPIYHK